MPRRRPDTPPTALGKIMLAEGRQPVWLAERVGVSRQAVWGWIWDGQRPTDATARKVARVLGRKLADLGWQR